MQFYKQLFLTNRFYKGLAALVLIYIVAFWWPALLFVAHAAVLVFALLVAAEIFWLFKSHSIFASRLCADKFSNGDENPVEITVENGYPAKVVLEVLDELPVQLQERKNALTLSLEKGAAKNIRYQVRPTKRGPYLFGKLHVYASGSLALVQRRYSFNEEKEVGVYPSFVQMRHYELLAISNHLKMAGQKKIRRAGNNREFEQIEKYVAGDDYRKINWKATARKNALMVNHYQDERSQNIVMAIDKGRAMKMPFAGLSLLDYAINAALVIGNIALRKGDRAGLVTFQKNIDGQVLPANRGKQLNLLLEQLYREKTAYQETNVRQLYTWLRYRINQRSLVMLYTNYESVHAMHRQLPYLKLINRSHLLLVVFFINTEIETLSQAPALGPEQIYNKGLAESLLLEKQQIAAELKQQGIQTLLTRPTDLNVNAINKYLELKARGSI